MRFLLLLILPIFVYSNTWILSYGYSKHFVHYHKNGKWNEDHGLFGIMQDINKTKYADAIQISRFKNSMFNWTYFATAIKRYKVTKNIYYGFQYGFISGYELNNGNYFPIATPLLGVEYDNFAIDISSGGREFIAVFRIGF